MSPAHAVIGAEMMYGVEQEMAMTLGDLLIRRTHLAFEMADQARSIARQAVELVAPLLFIPLDRDRAIREYESEVDRIFGAPTPTESSETVAGRGVQADASGTERG